MTVYAEGGTEDSPQQQEPSDRGNQATGARTNKHVPDEESKFVIDVENKSTEDFWGYEFRNLGGDGDWAFRCASVAYSLETGRPLTEATTATKSFIAILPCPLSLSLHTLVALFQGIAGIHCCRGICRGVKARCTGKPGQRY